MFKQGTIQGTVIKPLLRNRDKRGWLTEIYREDEVIEEYRPVMGYISMTEPGVVRGPHEHTGQADYFCFLGPSNFRLYLWDNRKASSTFMTKQVIVAGEGHPMSVIIPAGVVHAYKNIGEAAGMVVNCPNRLYAGRGKKEPVDEIRHESDSNSMFVVD